MVSVCPGPRSSRGSHSVFDSKILFEYVTTRRAQLTFFGLFVWTLLPRPFRSINVRSCDCPRPRPTMPSTPPISSHVDSYAIACNTHLATRGTRECSSETSRPSARVRLEDIRDPRGLFNRCCLIVRANKKHVPARRL